MRGRKRLSPFEKLVREIEGLVADTVYQSQLHELRNEPVNTDFVLGYFSACRYLLERAYAISNSRSIGNELVDMPYDEWLRAYHEATKRWD